MPSPLRLLFAVLLLPTGVLAQSGLTNGDFGDGDVTFFPAVGVSDVTYHTAGSILVTGMTRAPFSSTHGALWRFNEAGRLDVSFGTNGTVELTDSEGTLRRVAVLSSGAVLTAGADYIGISPSTALWRFTDGGAPDTDFGEDGISYQGLGIRAALSLYAPEGGEERIVHSFTTRTDIFNDPLLCYAERLFLDGSEDPAFQAEPVAADSQTVCFDHATQDDGRVVFFLDRADREELDSFTEWGAARLLADGTPDPSFGTDGSVFVSVSPNSILGEGLRAGAVMSDGSVVLGGQLNRPVTLVRFTESGTLDPSFGTDGIAVISVLGSATLQNLLALPDGRLAVAGYRPTSESSRVAFVARLLPEGTLDESFGEGGVATPDLGLAAGTRSSANALALDAAGNLIVVGTADGGSGFLLRLLPDGTVNAEDGAAARRVALHAPHPNPANAQATIAFTLSRTVPVRLAVHDLLGREVAVPVDAVYGPGRHEVSLRTAGLAPGVYLVRLRAGREAHVRRLTVVR